MCGILRCAGPGLDRKTGLLFNYQHLQRRYTTELPSVIIKRLLAQIGCSSRILQNSFLIQVYKSTHTHTSLPRRQLLCY